MTKNKERKEMTYHMTMVMVKNLLGKGIITRKEYVDFNAKMQKKYKLENSSLFVDIDLL